MPVFKLVRFSRPEVLRSINPTYLLRLLKPHSRFFRNHGLTLPSIKAAASLDHQALMRILASPEIGPPAELVDALFYIHEMATHEGMQALMEAVPLEKLGGDLFDMPPADVAVRAWLLNPRAVERAHAEFFAAKARRFEYFQSYSAAPDALPQPTEAQLLAMEQVLDEEFGRKGRGRVTRVFAYPHTHDCLFMIRHGDPYRREGALQGKEATSVLYRPMKFDLAIYDLAGQTLRIHAKTDWETSLYRGQIGLHLFGAIDYFTGEGRYDLRPLQSDTDTCFACHDVPGVKVARLIEVRLQWGGPYDAIEVQRASDVLAAFKHRKTQMPTKPKIIQATFELEFYNQTKPRSVTITPPNLARYSHDEDAPVIDRWLAMRKFVRGLAEQGETSNAQAEPVLAFL